LDSLNAKLNSNQQRIWREHCLINETSETYIARKYSKAEGIGQEFKAASLVAEAKRFWKLICSPQICFSSVVEQMKQKTSKSNEYNRKYTDIDNRYDSNVLTAEEGANCEDTKTEFEMSSETMKFLLGFWNVKFTHGIRHNKCAKQNFND
jgi:hypothetical protein